jgi:hypothetical protein
VGLDRRLILLRLVVLFLEELAVLVAIQDRFRADLLEERLVVLLLDRAEKPDQIAVEVDDEAMSLS